MDDRSRKLASTNSEVKGEELVVVEERKERRLAAGRDILIPAVRLAGLAIGKRSRMREGTPPPTSMSKFDLQGKHSKPAHCNPPLARLVLFLSKVLLSERNKVLPPVK